MTKAEIEARLAQYRDALRSMNTERWVAEYAEDGVVLDPVGGPPHRGHKELADFFNGVRQNFKLLDMTPQFQVFTPPGAVVKWSVRAVPVQGPEFIFEGISTYRFREDGKLTQMHAYWDMEDPRGVAIKRN
jgi:hypothetical protein